MSVCLASFFTSGTVHAQGSQYVYAGGVAIMTADPATGALTSIPGSPFATGYGPGVHTVDPSGRFAYAVVGSSIAAYTISQSSGEISLVSKAPFPAPWNPQFIAIDGGGKFLYAYNSDPNLSGSSYPGGPNFLVYAINPSSGALRQLPSTAPLPSWPNGVNVIATDPAGQFLYAAGCTNQWDDRTPCNEAILAFSISPDGTLTNVPGSPFAAGNSGIPAGLAVDPEGRFLVLDTNTPVNAFWYSPLISTFMINPSTGALAYASSAPGGVTMAPAAASNQMVDIDPTGKFVYAATPSGVAAYTVDGTTGAIQMVTGSPFDGGTFQPYYQGVSVALGGQFVYATQIQLPTNACEQIVVVAAFQADSQTGVLSTVPGSPFSTNLQSRSACGGAPVPAPSATIVTPRAPN